MALFKISKGNSSKLPQTYNEGYCYLTTDEHKFYIDTSDIAEGRICLNAAIADTLTKPYELSLVINGETGEQSIYLEQIDNIQTRTGIAIHAHDSKVAGVIKPTAQWIYGPKNFKDSVYIGDNFQYYILPDNINNQRDAKMSVPYQLSLRRSEASATGVAYIKNEAIQDFTTISTSNSISQTYYHKTNGGVTLLLGSTCIVDKTNDDGTTSTLNSNYYSGFRYPSFNSTTHEYTGYDINFYIPTLYSLDLTQSATYYFLTSANWKATAPHRLLYTTSVTSGGRVATSSHYCTNTALGVNSVPTDSYNFSVYGDSDFTGAINVDGNKVIINDTYYPSFELRAKTANSASTYSSAQFECNYTDNVGMWIWSDYTDSAKNCRGLILYGYKSGKDSNNCVALRQCDDKGTWLDDLCLLHSGNYTNYTVTKNGTGATGTWNINITGSSSYLNNNKIQLLVESNNNLSPFILMQSESEKQWGIEGVISSHAARVHFYKNNVWETSHWLLDDSNYSNYALPLTGGNVTGNTAFHKDLYVSENVHFRAKETVKSGSKSAYRNSICIYGDTYGNDSSYIKTAGKLSYGDPGPQIIFGLDDTLSNSQKIALIFTDHDTIASGASLSLVSTESSCSFIAPKVIGAVWNDYAEYRQASTKEPGRCVVEKGDDTLELSTARLLPGANIVSDTFGFAIGETENCTTPIAVSGRVLAYPYEPRDQFKAGDAVCSGPNGTVSIMTREEIREYPERIIGTVSSVPTYERWGSGNVLVDGRVWIKV